MRQGAHRNGTSMSAFGTYETCRPGEIGSAFNVKPDIAPPFAQVRALPQSRHKLNRDPAAQRSPALLRCDILSIRGANRATAIQGLLAGREVIR